VLTLRSVAGTTDNTTTIHDSLRGRSVELPLGRRGSYGASDHARRLLLLLLLLLLHARERLTTIVKLLLLLLCSAARSYWWRGITWGRAHGHI